MKVKEYDKKCKHEWTQFIGNGGTGLRTTTGIIGMFGRQVIWHFYCRKCLEIKEV